MAAFIYFYSKFTEEFLLLTAAAMFTLMSIYCYHWVIKKRRLGAARNQVPAGMVKAYLNQLIGEAQFVRTQLFGLIANGENPENIASFQGLLLKGQTPSSAPSFSAATEGSSTSIPSDLLDRLKALEAQLSEKESMVVNINVEKTKLLEEVENLKQNEKVMRSAEASNQTEDLSRKIKSLEERLEEYSLFEDDLANLKRLQQENSQLKKRLEEAGSNPAPEARVAAEPAVKEPKVEPTIESEPILKEAAPFSLDQDAIDALLNGVTPASPSQKQSVKEEPAVEPMEAQVAASVAPVALAAVPSISPVAEAPKEMSLGDEFEKLVDSVETSLEANAVSPAAEKQPEVFAAAPAAVAAPVVAAAMAAPVASAPEESVANKTDEELLKEFENLLNS